MPRFYIVESTIIVVIIICAVCFGCSCLDVYASEVSADAVVAEASQANSSAQENFENDSSSDFNVDQDKKDGLENEIIQEDSGNAGQAIREDSEFADSVLVFMQSQITLSVVMVILLVVIAGLLLSLCAAIWFVR